MDRNTIANQIKILASRVTAKLPSAVRSYGNHVELIFLVDLLAWGKYRVCFIYCMRSLLVSSGSTISELDPSQDLEAMALTWKLSLLILSVA